MFTGTYRHTLDSKGRLFIPVRLRMELGDRFMVAPGPRQCLWLYPEENWKAFSEKLASLPETRSWKIRHFFFSHAFETVPDAQGRITLPAESRRFAHLEKNVVLVGDDTRLELWDESAWDELERGSCEDILPLLEELGF